MSVATINTVVSSPALRADLERRFFPKIARAAENACWNWIAKSRHMFGYGVIKGGKGLGTINSHVAAWALENGPVPTGACVLHTCDNPGCCNPAHLYIGSHADNMADVKRRKRGRLGQTHSPEVRRKIADARAKNPPVVSDEGRKAQSEALRKRWQSPEWRANFKALTSGERNPRFGKRPPEHQLEAVRIAARARRGYKHSEDTKQKIRAGQLAHQQRLRNERQV